MAGEFAGLFYLGLCVGVASLLVVIGQQVFGFRWRGARFQYSLGTLLAGITLLGCALAFDRYQQQSDALLRFPLAGTLLFFLLFAGMFAAILLDFRPRSRRRPTALELHRQRNNAPVAVAADNSNTPPATGKRKWWLRKIPSRFRSIGHREMQQTRSSGFYNREG